MQRSPALLLWLNTLARSRARTHSAGCSPLVPGQIARQQHTEPANLQTPGPKADSHPETPAPGQSFTPSPEASSARTQSSAGRKGPRSSIDLCWQQIDSQSHLPGDEVLTDVMQVYRRHNTSLPILEGQMIVCRVLMVSRQSVLLDTGEAACLHPVAITIHPSLHPHPCWERPPGSPQDVMLLQPAQRLWARFAKHQLRLTRKAIHCAVK